MKLRPSLRPVGYGLAATFAYGVLLSLVGIALAVWLRSWVVVAVLFPLGLPVPFLFLGLLGQAWTWMLTRYTADEDGLVVETGLLNTRRHAVPWEKVSVIQWGHGIFEGWAGLSRIEASAYGASGARVTFFGLRDGRSLWRWMQAQADRHATSDAWLGND